MNAFVIAWRASRYFPISVIRSVAWVGAVCAWSIRGKAVTRLEENLSKVTGLTGKPLRKLSKRGMKSVASYYAEIFELPRMSLKSIDARVRLEHGAELLDIMETEGRVVIPVSHSGNWDLLGAFAGRNIGHVTSVAEVLKPVEVFDEFVRFREKLGMTIFGHEGSSTFRKLLGAISDEGGVVALVADRDLSGHGINVQMWGHSVRVAPGPAALAAASSSALIPVMVYSERLTGQRRKAAKSRTGKVMKCGPVIRVPDGPKSERVQSMTESWVAYISDEIAAHPEDWHMLQRFGWTE